MAEASLSKAFLYHVLLPDSLYKLLKKRGNMNTSSETLIAWNYSHKTHEVNHDNQLLHTLFLALVEPQVLPCTDYGKWSVLNADASDKGLCVVLLKIKVTNEELSDIEAELSEFQNLNFSGLKSRKWSKILLIIPVHVCDTRNLTSKQQHHFFQYPHHHLQRSQE